MNLICYLPGIFSMQKRNQLRAEQPTRKCMLGSPSGKMTLVFLSLFRKHFASLRNVNLWIQTMNGAWALTEGQSKRHEAPQLPYFIFFLRKQEQGLCSSCSQSIYQEQIERGEEEMGSQFPFLISYFHGFCLLPSGSEPAQQMEPFTPPSCLVYTRHGAQKPRQKTLLADNGKWSSLTFLPSQYGLQKNPVTSFYILHCPLINEVLPWYIY